MWPNTPLHLNFIDFFKWMGGGCLGDDLIVMWACALTWYEHLHFYIPIIYSLVTIAGAKFNSSFNCSSKKYAFSLPFSIIVAIIIKLRILSLSEMFWTFATYCKSYWLFLLYLIIHCTQCIHVCILTLKYFFLEIWPKNYSVCMRALNDIINWIFYKTVLSTIKSALCS